MLLNRSLLGKLYSIFDLELFKGERATSSQFDAVTLININLEENKLTEGFLIKLSLSLVSVPQNSQFGFLKERAPTDEDLFGSYYFVVLPVEVQVSEFAIRFEFNFEGACGLCHFSGATSTYSLKPETPFMFEWKPLKNTIGMAICFKDFLFINEIWSDFVRVFPNVWNPTHIVIDIVGNYIIVLFPSVGLMVKYNLLLLNYNPVSWGDLLIYQWHFTDIVLNTLYRSEPIKTAYKSI